jgi:hypothetical protein
MVAAVKWGVIPAVAVEAIPDQIACFKACSEGPPRPMSRSRR